MRSVKPTAPNARNGNGAVTPRRCGGTTGAVRNGSRSGAGSAIATLLPFAADRSRAGRGAGLCERSRQNGRRIAAAARLLSAQSDRPYRVARRDQTCHDAAGDGGAGKATARSSAAAPRPSGVADQVTPLRSCGPRPPQSEWNRSGRGTWALRASSFPCRAGLCRRGPMLAAERKHGPRPVLLDQAARRSPLRGIGGRREFCVLREWGSERRTSTTCRTSSLRRRAKPTPTRDSASHWPLAGPLQRAAPQGSPYARRRNTSGAAEGRTNATRKPGRHRVERASLDAGQGSVFA